MPHCGVTSEPNHKAFRSRKIENMKEINPVIPAEIKTHPFWFHRQMLFVAAFIMFVSTQAVAGDMAPAIDPGFARRCKDPSVVLCIPLASEAEISRFQFAPKHLDANQKIQWDASTSAARFTIPPHSPADSSGQLHIPLPHPMVDIFFSFDVRYPADLLRYKFKGGGGWKIFILGQGKEGCAPYELVANNPYYRGYASFYYICGARSQNVAVQNPLGNNSSQFDYQPGGDTACMRSPEPRAKPCGLLEADEWINYQVHINTLTAVLEIWQTVRGKTLKIIDFQLQNFPMPPPKYEWLKLTPYNTGKDPSEDHPLFSLWYRRVIVSSHKIPFPGAE